MPQTSITGSPQLRISRGMVSIYKEFLGRGPTSAQTTICDDFVTTICRHSLTKAERRLVDNGEADTVRNVRRKFQTAMSNEILDLVEETTGRRGATLMSDHDVEQDIAVETVVFESTDSLDRDLRAPI